MANILDILSKTIEQVQAKNQKDKNVPTADPSIFDLLKNELGKLDGKVKANEVQKGKRNPKSILDLVRAGIEGVRKENRKDKNVETADKSIFDQILKKVEAPAVRQASTGLKKVVEDYKLDLSHLPQEVIGQVQQQYYNELKKFNHQYAQALFDLNKKSAAAAR